MHWVVYNLWYIVLDLLGSDEEAERIFAEAEKFLSEAKLNEELFKLYNLKVVIMFSFYPSFQFWVINLTVVIFVFEIGREFKLCAVLVLYSSNTN